MTLKHSVGWEVGQQVGMEFRIILGQVIWTRMDLAGNWPTPHPQPSTRRI